MSRCGKRVRGRRAQNPRLEIDGVNRSYYVTHLTISRNEYVRGCATDFVTTTLWDNYGLFLASVALRNGVLTFRDTVRTVLDRLLEKVKSLLKLNQQFKILMSEKNAAMKTIHICLQLMVKKVSTIKTENECFLKIEHITTCVRWT